MKTKYIRGWRQLKAVLYFFECLLAFHNPFWSRMKCATRELHIMTGFAKPYKIIFAPSFWKSLDENFDLQLSMDWIQAYEQFEEVSGE